MSNADFFIMPNLSNQILKKADALHLKLLIFIAQNNEVSVEGIVNEFNLDKKETLKALSFLETNKLIFIMYINGDAFYCPMQNQVKRNESLGNYGNADIEKNLKDNDYLKFLAYKTEQKIGRPLSIGELKTLFGAYDWLKLPVEVILILVDYCCEIDKRNFKYIEKIALEWSKLSIYSIEEAQKHIKSIKDNNKFLTKVKNILNLGDKELNLSEKKYISKWEIDNISEEQIIDAYEKTIKNTGKCALAYMNKIIMSQDAKQNVPKVNGYAKPLTRNKKSRFDFEEIERMDLEFLKKFEDEDM